MYLLLAFLQVFAAAARLAKNRICDLFRSAAPVGPVADAFGHSPFHLSLSSSPCWVLPTGDVELAPPRLHIANAGSESTSLASS